MKNAVLAGEVALLLVLHLVIDVVIGTAAGPR